MQQLSWRQGPWVLLPSLRPLVLEAERLHERGWRAVRFLSFNFLSDGTSDKKFKGQKMVPLIGNVLGFLSLDPVESRADYVPG